MMMNWWLMHLAEYASIVSEILEPHTRDSSFVGMTLVISKSPAAVQPVMTYNIRFRKQDCAHKLALQWRFRFADAIDQVPNLEMITGVKEDTLNGMYTVIIRYVTVEPEQNKEQEGQNDHE